MSVLIIDGLPYQPVAESTFDGQALLRFAESGRAELIWPAPADTPDAYIVRENGIDLSQQPDRTYLLDSLSPGTSKTIEVLALRAGEEESLGTVSFTLPAAMTTADFDTITANLVVFFSTYQRSGGYDASDYLAEVQPDGTTSSGSATGSLFRLFEALKDYHDPANTNGNQGNVTIMEQGVNTLNWCMANLSTDAGWRNDQVLYPRYVGEVSVMMRAYLNTQRGQVIGTSPNTVDIDSLLLSVEDWLNNAYTEVETIEAELIWGANLLYRLLPQAALAVLNDSQAEADRLRRYLDLGLMKGFGSDLQENQGGFLGFVQDGLFFQHNNSITYADGQQLSANYGMDAAKDLAVMGSMVRGTPLAFADANWDVITGFYESMYQLCYYDYIYPVSLQRYATDVSDFRQLGTWLRDQVVAYQTYKGAEGKADDLLADIAANAGSSHYGEGYHAWPQTGLVKLGRSGYSWVGKDGGVDSNGMDQGDGWSARNFLWAASLMLFLDPDSFHAIRPLLGTKFMGVVSEDKDENDLPGGQGVQRVHPRFASWLRANMQHAFGTAQAFQYHRVAEYHTIEYNTLRAVIHTDELAVSFQDIRQTGTPDGDVVITLLQAKWDPVSQPISYGNGVSAATTRDALFAKETIAVSTPYFVSLTNSVALLIIPHVGSINLQLEGASRSGDFSFLDGNNSSGAITENVLEILINLGTNPQGVDFTYMIVPQIVAGDAADRLPGNYLPDNQPGIIALPEDSNGCTTVAFFQAGTSQGITTDQPCLVWTSEASARVVAMDPATDSINLQIAGKTYLVKSAQGQFGRMPVEFALP